LPSMRMIFPLWRQNVGRVLVIFHCYLKVTGIAFVRVIGLFRRA